MKALPGLLIEYLVTGTVVILTVLIVDAVCTNSIYGFIFVGSANPVQIAVVIPAVYCLGMIVDYLSKVAVEAIAKVVKKVWDKSARKFSIVPLRKTHPPSYSQHEIMARSEALGGEYIMRSSRDRVARGLFFSVLISSLVIGQIKRLGSEALVAFVLSILSFCVWWRFDHLSSRWKYKSTVALKNISKGSEEN